MGKQVMLFLLLLVLGFGVPGRAQSPENGQQQKPSAAAEKPTQTARQQQSQKAETTADDKDSKSTNRKTHFLLGGITLGASYTDFGRSFIAPLYPYYPYYPYGAFSVGAFYTPFVGNALYGPFYVPPRAAFDLNYALGKGEVELKSLGPNKNASVYIDNAYAGKAGKLKHMWLGSGAYDLSLAAADGSTFHQRIYVLSGKKLKITPEFKMNANAPQNEEKR